MKIKAFKGFERNMRCRDFQYEEGKTYKTDGVSICNCGFHACKMPADVFKYYGFNDSEFDSKFYEVELDGQIDESEKDSKVASTEITIKTEKTVSDLLRAQCESIEYEYEGDNVGCEYLFNNAFFKVVTSPEVKYIASIGSNSIAALCKSFSSIVTCGDTSISSIVGQCSMSLADGECSIASSIGRYNISIASGPNSIATSAGDDSKTMATGICSISASTSQRALTRTSGMRSIAATTNRGSEATATGIKSVAINTSPYSGRARTTGDESIAVSFASDSSVKSTGNKSIAIGTGSNAFVNVSGEGSVAIVKGLHSRGYGSLGSYIIFIYDDENGETKTKMIHITGKKYKPDTSYCLNSKHKVVEWGKYSLSTDYLEEEGYHEIKQDVQVFRK